MNIFSFRRGGAGLSSRLDFLSVKRNSIPASDDSQNADDSVGDEEAAK